METDVAILTAAVQQRVVEIQYAPGHRLIEPHALGYGADGQILLRAYQIEGASASGEHEHWKLFRLDRVDDIGPTTGNFHGPRPAYKRDDRAMKGGIIAQL